MMSNIYSTRRGFLYQDRYALLCYFEHFLKNDVQEFFIDYPLIGKRSLDIRIINSESEEKVYEIKSGQQFKEKRKEIIEAIINLHAYSQEQPKSNLHLIISKEFSNQISRYWDAINQLKRYQDLRTDVAKQALKLLPILNIKSENKRHSFYQSLMLDASFDDQKDGESDEHPNIVDQLLSKIEDLIAVFGLKSCEYEWPKELLMHKLIYESAQYAGTKTNLKIVFKKVIMDFLIKRKFMAEHYKYNQQSGSKPLEENKIREAIELQYSERFDQPTKLKMQSTKGDSAGDTPR